MQINLCCIDQCKQEVHDQTLVGKKADSAVFGVSVVRAVRAQHSILTALSKREEAS